MPSSDPVPALDKKGPRAHPLIVPMVSFFLLSAFLSYNTTGAGSLPVVYSASTGLVGTWGLWVVSAFSNGRPNVPDPAFRPICEIIFAGPKRISRKTGADKHTSAFIFGNKSSASEQQKRWRREPAKRGVGH